MHKGIRKVNLILLSLALFASSADLFASETHETAAIAQQRRITGTISDATGPITGATVTIKGKTTGTVTDVNGNFTLSGIKQGDIIQISFVGYVPQEIKYTGQPTLDILMKEDSKALDEVVVIGYGTQKKVNLTGSVSMVDSKVLESRPVQNVGQALQGQIPGLNLSVNSGGGTLDNTLNINVRGTGTIGSGSTAAPLILIDGIEGNMNTLNPNDIENISVLKDAASASIYGARGSFGVILITTKSGKIGKPTIQYQGNVRFTDALQIPKMMDSFQFATYFNKSAKNAGQSAVFSAEIMDLIQKYQAGEIDYTQKENPNNHRYNNYTGSFANTDWFKEMYKNWVPSHEHNLSVSGGTESLNYRISGSFMNQNGLIRFGKDKMNRYTLDAKIQAKLTPWLTMRYSNKWQREEYERPTYMTALFFHNIARRWPTCPVYTPNGYLNEGMEVIQMRDGGIQTQKKNYYTNQLAFVFEPIKDWHINLEGNMRTFNNGQHWAVLPVYGHDSLGNPYAISWDGGASYSPGQSRIYEYRYTSDYFTTNLYTDYSKIFGNHYIKGMIGLNAELTKTDWISGQGDNLTSYTTPYLSQTQEQKKSYGGQDHNSVAGYFGRINYSYMDRYMVEFNARYDGSSRFIGDKRWGFFPSVSAGWNIAREEFFGNLGKTISTLKLRGSYGRLGNTNTDSWYPFYQVLSTSTANSAWLIDGKKQNTASAPGIISTAMTWEKVESWDAGLDWAAFNNRLTGSFDYFKRMTKDMVGPAQELPSVLGTSAPKINNADMKSYGFELEISWRDRIKDFSYGIRAVLSDAQQEITRYPNETLSLSTYYNGRKMGEIWGYTTVGIANSADEMTTHLANNKPSWGSNWGAGDIMYKDLNGDGKVNSGSNTKTDPGDMKIIGNSTPRYLFGITLDCAWRGIDFSAFLQGVAKRDYWLSGPYFFGASGGMWQSAGFKNHWDFWRPEGDELGANTNAYYARASFDGTKNQYTQTRYLQDASYIRLKNIQLGYTLPQIITKKAGISSVRFYVSGDNLLTFSNITGIFDPETLGGDWGDGKLYPLCKTISFGLNLTF